MSSNSFPIIVITKAEIAAKDTASVLEVLSSLMQSPGHALTLCEQVDIVFHGYDEIGHELFEMPQVRDYVRMLDEIFPYWLYFLTKSGTGLQCIAYCFLPPSLTPEGKQKHFPLHLNHLLKRWFSAMNQVCEWTNFSEEQIELLSNRSLRYFFEV